MSSPLYDLLAGAGVGLVGGVTSGLLGVSPGGGLVVSSNLLLGSEQHVAQGLSLFAQIPPTGLSGIKRYWEKGSRTPMRWLVLLTTGLLFGGIAGALAAGSVSSSFLRWIYVFYLAILDALLIFRPRHKQAEESCENFAGRIPWAALLVVGVIAGFSSGFPGNWRRIGDHRGSQRRFARAATPSPIGQPRLLDNSYHHPRRIRLLARRMVGALARHRRRGPGALGRNGPRGSHRQPRQRDRTSPPRRRVRLRDGDLYGLQGDRLTALVRRRPRAHVAALRLTRR